MLKELEFLLGVGVASRSEQKTNLRSLTGANLRWSTFLSDCLQMFKHFEWLNYSHSRVINSFPAWLFENNLRIERGWRGEKRKEICQKVFCAISKYSKHHQTFIDFELRGSYVRKLAIKANIFKWYNAVYSFLTHVTIFSSNFIYDHRRKLS